MTVRLKIVISHTLLSTFGVTATAATPSPPVCASRPGPDDRAAMNEFVRLCSRDNTPRAALMAERLFTLASASRARSDLAWAWSARGRVSKARGQFAASAEQFEKSAPLFGEQDPERAAMMLKYAATARASNGDNAGAYRDLRAALTIAERSRSAMAIATADYTLAALFLEIEDYRSAIAYAQKASEIARTARDPRTESTALGIISDIYRRQGLPAQALTYQQNALDLVRTTPDERGTVFAKYSIAALYVDLGRYADAAPLLDEAERYFTNISDLEALADLKLTRASLLLKSGNVAEAITLARSSYAMAEPIAARPIMARAANFLSRAFAASGDYASAWRFTELDASFDKELRAKAVQNAIVRWRIQYEVDQKERQLADATRIAALTTQTVTRQRNSIIVLTLLAAVIAAFAAAQFSGRRRRRKLNREIADRSTEIERQAHTLSRNNEELEGLYEIAKRLSDARALSLREVHHRVRNSLNLTISLIDLQLRKLRGSGLVEGAVALQQIQSRVYAIASIHTRIMTNEDLENVDVSGTLESLTDDLREIYSSDAEVEFAIVPTLLPVALALPLSLLACELLTNAFRYGIPADGRAAKVRVSLDWAGDDCQFVVSDNGPGMGAHAEAVKHGTGLGLSLVRDLALQLDGRAVVESDPGKGVTWTITVPTPTGVQHRMLPSAVSGVEPT